jgi:hypothetical protein
MATFLHSRTFLSYHQDRFKDKSLVFLNAQDEWIAVFPAAVDPIDSGVISSHPGSSYGGILHAGRGLGSCMIELLSQMIIFYQKKGFSRLIYKAVPSFYHQVPSQDDLYGLFRVGATLFRRDLSCTLDLQGPGVLSNKALSKMRNMMRKSESNGVCIEWDNPNHFDLFWAILEENLQKKYAKKPVHTLEEIKILKNRFGQNIHLVTACQKERVLAGTILFKTETTLHTQYLSVTQDGKALFALDFLIQTCIEFAKKRGYKFFDFGINTENNGHILNESLYQSKVKHSGSGTVQDFYEVDLKRGGINA